MSRYHITVPGKLYQSLASLNIFGESSEDTQAAFTDAVPQPFGRGVRYVMTGSRITLKTILDELDFLVWESENRVAPAYQLGVDLQVLKRCARQPLQRP